MIITCAQCQTRFRVDDGLIKETGTRVRCSNCQNVFTVFHPGSRGEDATLSRGPIPRPPARENPPRTAAGENAGRGRAAEGSRPKTGGDCPGREETGKDATLGLSRPAATRPAAPPETQAASRAAPRTASQTVSGVKPKALVAKPILPADRDFIIPDARPDGGAERSPRDPGNGAFHPPPDAPPGPFAQASPTNGPAAAGTAAGELANFARKVERGKGGQRDDPGRGPADLGLGYDPASDRFQTNARGAPHGQDPNRDSDGGYEGDWDGGLEAAPDRRSPDFFDPRRDPYAEKAVPKAEPIKIRKKGPSGKSVAILASVAILGLLAAAAFFFFAKEGAMNSPKGTTAGRGAPLPDGTVLAGSSPQRVPKPGEATEANLVTDADNKNHLIFTKEQTTHHYRSNEKHGNILIITGRITNEYSDPRSFIKVKAILKNSKGTVVAEREAFAGNYLNEADLISLPMNEILTRLAIRGGQSSANINVAPGSSIPFMLVFDKLPDDLAEYVVEAVGSTPSGGMATGGLPGTPGSPGSPGDGAVS